MPPLSLIRLSIAAVWLYEGLWCKLLGRMPHQGAVVQSVPFFGERFAGLFLTALGIVECGLALWVLSGWEPYLAALAQTVLLVTLNTNGIIFARRLIHDPAGMVIKNIAFLVLAWVAAAQAGR
jgi:uncharacterized membrane protein YphA (DoxX/SURF4 family)